MSAELTFRQRHVSRPVLNWIRGVLPAMSETEREALAAGTIGWEADLLRGDPDFAKLLATPTRDLSAEEQAFLDGPTEELCRLIDDWKITFEHRDIPSEIWDFLKAHGFLGLVIPEQYGGKGFSATANSAIVMKIASRGPSAAVAVIVPNSLGPGELLMMFGTDEQKDYWLPRLADGREIPSFALTSLDAGSDAASMTDSGVVCWGEVQGEKTLGMRVNWSKRYISLAPICTVLGLAFKVKDPERLLGEEHPITMAAIGNLAVALTRLGRTEESEAVYRRLIELEERMLPQDDLDRTYSLNNLGVHYANIGRFTEAEPLLREALRIRVSQVDETDASLPFSNENLGMMLREAGRYEEAEPFLNRGLYLRRKLLGEEHRWIAESLFSNGLLYALWGRPGDHVRADSMLRASLAMYDATTGPDHPGKAYTFHALGQLEMQRDDAAAAERWFREALRLRQQPRDAPRVAVQTRVELAHALRAQGRAAEARALGRRAARGRPRSRRR